MKRRTLRPSPRPTGFTLVEVLVSLGIFAIALTAGMEATGAMTRQAQRQAAGLLAEMCAENELMQIRLLRQMPGIGDTEVRCEQGGRVFTVTVTVRPTPNANFRRVDARVSEDGMPVTNLSTVVGRF